MATNNSVDSLSFLQAPLQLPTESRGILYAIISIVVGYILITQAYSNKSGLPYANYNKSHWTWAEGKAEYQSNARKLIAEGFRKFSGPFNLITGHGPIIMLPPEYIESVNAEPKLSFLEWSADNFLSYLETFKTYRHEAGAQNAVQNGLTRSLPKFTKPLSDEMSGCLNDTWGSSTEWHAVYPRGDILKWVARLSTRIFLGEEMAKNEEWLRLSIDHTVNSFMAVDKLKFNYPEFLIPLVDKFHPLCRKVRAERAACERILGPVLAQRDEEIKAAVVEGRKPNVPNDAIEWFRTEMRGRSYDAVNLQMGLALAAIHTTSDLLAQSMLNLALYPEYVEPLRKEAIDVLNKFGWKKVALTELRMLDSFLKETQRLKPISMTSMHRIALADVELPGGVKVKKGEHVVISSHRMWDNSIYEQAEVFDGYRFLKRRQIPGLENRSSLISTSTDHTAFSHGRHACPGRFFAANEVKIAMVHLLMKYDIELDDKESAKWIENGDQMMASFTASPRVRRRKEEIDVDNVVVD